MYLVAFGDITWELSKQNFAISADSVFFIIYNKLTFIGFDDIFEVESLAMDSIIRFETYVDVLSIFFFVGFWSSQLVAKFKIV